MTVDPVTREIAKLAGKIGGEQAALGVSVAFEDSLDWYNGIASRLLCRHAQRSSLPDDPGCLRCAAVAETVP
jgi:hypothetical protein